MDRHNYSGRLLQYLSHSTSAARAADNAVDWLHAEGFEELFEGDAWQLSAGRKILVRRGPGGVIAVRVGSESVSETGFRIVAAHTDSPTLKLKPRGIRRKKGGVYVPVEVYGGPIQPTWLDRELILTGTAVIRDNAGRLVRRSFATKEPCAIIPNLAIHLNRDINKGFEYNAQDHLQIRLCLEDDAADTGESRTPATQEGAATADQPTHLLWNEIARTLSCSASDIRSADVFVADPRPAQFLADGSTFVSGRIDNLAGCYTSVQAFLECDNPRDTLVVALFDNEEIGSKAAGGADSGFLESVLRRVCRNDGTLFARAMAKSILLSNDGAHALQDSYSAKYDADYAPVLGAGPAVKTNASYRYASTTEAIALVTEVAEENGISLQYLAGRSDMRTGSTIGPFAWSRTGASTVDLGVPMLAMHSIRETASMRDVTATIRLLSALLAVEVGQLP